MPRMRIWDCGELGLSFDLGALKIYQMLNRWFVSSHTTHTQTNTTNYFTSVSHFVFVSLFLHKFTTCLNLQLHQHSNNAISVVFFYFVALFFSPHLFKVIYCRLFTACRLLSPQLLLLLSGQLWNLFQLANFGASATPFTVAVRPVTKQLDTLPQVARQRSGGYGRGSWPQLMLHAVGCHIIELLLVLLMHFLDTCLKLRR